MGDLERALRQHSDATDVLREYLRFQSPAYYRSCHVVRTPLTLAQSFPNVLWPSHDARGYATTASARAAASARSEFRVEACGALVRLQTSTASMPYLEGVRSAFAAAVSRQPSWTDSAAGAESSDAIRELANTLQSLVDNYQEEA